jgi:hypothetical protein
MRIARIGTLHAGGGYRTCSSIKITTDGDQRIAVLGRPPCV